MRLGDFNGTTQCRDVELVTVHPPPPLLTQHQLFFKLLFVPVKTLVQTLYFDRFMGVPPNMSRIRGSGYVSVSHWFSE